MDTALAPAQGLDFYSSGLASGRNDIFETFLGPPAREAKTSPYAKKSTAKFNMPENYIGENLYLRDTVEDYMLTARWNFWTQRILPWYRTDQIHMQWTEWENNPHYLGITPHQAPSRLVTQRRTIRKASIIRRGIAAEFELDFVTTPLGKTSFTASLGQMARSVDETGNVEVLRALLGCHRYQQVYIRKHGVVSDNDLDSWLQRKADRFMAAQKDPFGLEMLATAVEQDQEQYNGKGDTWILGREVADYCRFRQEKSLYYMGGQEAVDNVNNRNRGRLAQGDTMGNVRSLEPPGMIGDTPVYFAKSNYVDSVGKAELLSRVVEVGVFNMMIDRCRDHSKYHSDCRNLRVYDNDIDDWSDIELITAIEKCPIWTKEGKLVPIYTKRSTHSVQDKENDFLSYPVEGNTRREIEYIGDMSGAYLTATHLQQAAQTLFSRLGEAGQKSFMQILANPANPQIRDSGSNEASATTAAKTAVTSASLRAAFAPFVSQLEDLVGSDNAWLTRPTRPGGLDERGEPRMVQMKSSIVDAFIDNFITPHMIHAVPANASVGAAAAGASAAGEMENKFLLEVLGAVVPDTHKQQLQAIASQADQPWTGRAQQIKELVLQIQKETPEAVSALEKPSDVDTWHNKQVKDFKTRLEKKFPAATAASASAAGGQEVHYFPAGAAIPAGWKVVQSPTGSIVSRMQAFKPAEASAVASVSGARRAPIGTHLSSAPGSRGVMSAEEKAADGINRLDGSNFVAHVKSIEQSSAPRHVKILAAIYAGCAFTRERLMEFARNHIYVPLGFLLMRPHATYKTRFGIKVAAGGQTGYTFFGHSDMRIETEATRKVGLMHYTTYLSAVVMQPKNVYVVEDLFCQKYLGGMGVEFWSAEEYKTTQNRKAKSIICAPLPPNFRRIEQKIDIRGRWYTEQRLGLVTAERFERPLYPGCGRMNVLLGLSDKASKVVSSRKVAVNFVCWQG